MSETEKTKEKTAKWHSMDGEAVVNKLGTSVEEGLTADEATIRLKKYGKNKMDYIVAYSMCCQVP